MRESLPSEVDKKLFFRIKRILNESANPEGAELIEGYRLKCTRADTATIATIYASDGAPILTTLCSKFGDDDAWALIHEDSSFPLATRPSAPPPAPYIADRIEIGAAMHMDALTWTGDFSRCFGWVVLAPQKIR